MSASKCYYELRGSACSCDKCCGSQDYHNIESGVYLWAVMESGTYHKVTLGSGSGYGEWNSSEGYFGSGGECCRSQVYIREW